ncbi:hypothetical protein J4407_02345 [Candidatus Pacearchaeota archaeon]|nr:hypothetical protein [Candidatus Pacearchaeota archaeon]
MNKSFKDKKAQVWVETVVYTLIALVLIGAVLAFVNPKIQEIQDRTAIEQSLTVLNNIDGIVSTVVQGGGNKRIVSVGIKKGTIEINGVGNYIVFSIDSEYEYSQTGEKVNIGKIVSLTERSGSINRITLNLSYSNYDIKVNSEDESKILTQAPNPYSISIENKGGAGPVLDFVVS